MRKFVSIGVVFAMIPAVFGCQEAHRSDAIAALKSDAAAWQTAARNRDAGAYAERYASTTILYHPGVPPVVGAAGMKQLMEKAFRDHNFSISQRPEIFDASEDGSMGFIQGAYRATFSDPRTGARLTEIGHYTTVFRRQQDGGYKVVADMGAP